MITTSDSSTSEPQGDPSAPCGGSDPFTLRAESLVHQGPAECIEGYVGPRAEGSQQCRRRLVVESSSDRIEEIAGAQFNQSGADGVRRQCDHPIAIIARGERRKGCTRIRDRNGQQSVVESRCTARSQSETRSARSVTFEGQLGTMVE